MDLDFVEAARVRYFTDEEFFAKVNKAVAAATVKDDLTSYQRLMIIRIVATSLMLEIDGLL